MSKIDEITRMEQELIQDEFARVMNGVKSGRYRTMVKRLYEQKEEEARAKLDRDTFLRELSFISRGAYWVLRYVAKLHMVVPTVFMICYLCMCVDVLSMRISDNAGLYKIAFSIGCFYLFYWRLRFLVCTDISTWDNAYGWTFVVFVVLFNFATGDCLDIAGYGAFVVVGVSLTVAVLAAVFLIPNSIVDRVCSER